jgi:hypothetical protein
MLKSMPFFIAVFKIKETNKETSFIKSSHKQWLFLKTKNPV